MLALAAFAPVPAGAETWHWHHLWHVVTGSTVDSQLTVTVGGGQAAWSYVALLEKRSTVIFSCHAPAADVDSASAFRDGNEISLVVALKAGRSANCGTTRQRVSAIPGDSYAQMQQIAAGINRALAANRPPEKPQPAPIAPRPRSPSPSAVPLESASPRATPRTSPVPRSNRSAEPAPSGAPEVVPDIRPRLLVRGTSSLSIGHRGVARVRVLVGADGTPEQASILSITDRALVPAAIETAVSSTYAPAKKNGRPIAATYVATFTFNGEDPALQSIPVWRRVPLATPTPTEEPSIAPTPAPTPTPTPRPTATPTPRPTPTPTPLPTRRPGAPALRGVSHPAKPTPTPVPTRAP